MFNLNLPSIFISDCNNMTQDEVIFYGHENIRSLHPRTIEITKDANLTLRGDCIVGIRANKSCSDLSQILRRLLKADNSIANIEIMVGKTFFKIRGRGSRELLLFNTHDIVIRKSNFICPRTLSISCDKASSDIPREMILSLQNPETKGLLRITVE
jgi:hypothetical protein